MSRVVALNEYETELHSEYAMCIVGHTTSSTAKIWTRTSLPGDWHLVLFDSLHYEVIRKSIDPLTAHANDALFVHASTQVQAARTFSFHDNTHCFEVQGLKPDCSYHYLIVADGATRDKVQRKIIVGSDHPHRFKTDPSESFKKFAFGFYSCHDPFGRKQLTEGLWPQFYDKLVELDARFTIGGGDQVYCDTHGQRSWLQRHKGITTVEDLWDWLKQNKDKVFRQFSSPTGFDESGLIELLTRIYHTYYRIYWNFPSLKGVFRRFPSYMIWDDHEIMDGWGSLTKAERMEKLGEFLGDVDPKMKELIAQSAFKAAKQAYLNYQHLHNPTTSVTPSGNLEDRRSRQTRNQEIWDYDFSKGKIGFYVLDTRNHHDVEHNAPGQKLLDEEQMQRFKDWLERSKSEGYKALFVVTAVPIVHWKDKLFYNRDFWLKKVGAKDDVIDEWGHKSNIAERNYLLDNVCQISHEAEMPITFLSGDVHSASAFRLKSQKYPKAQVMNITASGISRKPPIAMAKYAIEGSGGMFKNPDIELENLFKMAGENNFLTVEVDDTGPLAITATVYFGFNASTQTSINIC